ncbi:MAG: hydrogenase maturation protease, partial [Desulfobacterales bacterium]|nr:hydrogenase maturation protease [Desulfobacterales bacterium]
MNSESLHVLEPREDILVIGVGNTLREDDGVGVHLVRKLKEKFSDRLNCIEVYEPDILLAEQMTEYAEALIIDAMVVEDGAPFNLVSLHPSKSMLPAAGFVTHSFDWGAVLKMAEELFGKSLRATLLGVSARSYGISETISPFCLKNA